MLLDIISFDQQLLLLLNGSDSLFWDGVWVAITSVATWLFFFASLLYVFFKSYPPRQVFIVLLAVGFAILFADQIASGICKPLFQRPRPSHEPLLMGLVDIVDGRRGGQYGFMSSHAANGFAIFTLLSLIIRHRSATFALLLYAMLSSYSRIYLGLHYPGDILCGALVGVLCGVLCYYGYLFLCSRMITGRRFYSTAYTSSGIAREDADIPIFAYLLSLVGVMIYATCYAAWH